MFNKLDNKMFEGIAKGWKNIPEKIRAIKQKMFVFDDLGKVPANALAKSYAKFRATRCMALRGPKRVRDHFLNALPARSRDMLQDEMKAMGLKSKDVKKAQSDRKRPVDSHCRELNCFDNIHF